MVFLFPKLTKTNKIHKVQFIFRIYSKMMHNINVQHRYESMLILTKHYFHKLTTFLNNHEASTIVVVNGKHILNIFYNVLLVFTNFQQFEL